MKLFCMINNTLRVRNKEGTAPNHIAELAHYWTAKQHRHKGIMDKEVDLKQVYIL